MVFTEEQIAEIEKKALAATEQIRVEFGSVEEYQKKREAAAAEYKAKLEDKSEAKEVRIGVAIARLPICEDGKSKVGELVKIITGLDFEVPVSIETDDIAQQHISFSIMVPTKNGNSHDYLVDGPVMMLGANWNNAFSTDGSRGNHLQWVGSGLRPATIDEIGTFFKIWRILSESGAQLCAGFDLSGTEIKEKDE